MRRMLVLAGLALAGCGSVPAAPVDSSRPSGLLFLAANPPGTIVRVDAGAGTATRHRVPQYGGGDPPYTLHYTGGRLTLRGWSLAPDLSDPRSLGEALFFVPSATPGRVWNLLLRPGGPRTEVHFRGVRELTVDGQRTFSRRARVPGWALAATSDGLVLQQRDGLVLWDPRRARVVRRLPGIFALGVRGSLVASCAFRCRAVHFTDTRTGARTVVRGRFTESYEGAFSADGRLFATFGQRQRVVVIDRARGTVRVVGRAAKDYKLLAWASSGWLFYNAGRGKLGAWRPGAAARRLPVNAGRFVDMTAD